MNAVVESPLEALVFDYVRFGVLGVLQNLWALLALLTAALSFWTIRSASSPAPSGEFDCISNSLPELEAEAVTGKSGVDEIKNDGEVVVVETKGNKFMVKYYHHMIDNNDGEDEEDTSLRSDGDNYEMCRREVVVAAGCWQWQWQMKTKMELEYWHRHVDVGMLDGNIVRLWDYSY